MYNINICIIYIYVYYVYLCNIYIYICNIYIYLLKLQGITSHASYYNALRQLHKYIQRSMQRDAHACIHTSETCMHTCLQA